MKLRLHKKQKTNEYTLLSVGENKCIMEIVEKGETFKLIKDGTISHLYDVSLCQTNEPIGPEDESHIINFDHVELLKYQNGRDVQHFDLISDSDKWTIVIKNMAINFRPDINKDYQLIIKSLNAESISTTKTQTEEK